MDKTERQQQQSRSRAPERRLEADGLRWTVREVPAPPLDRRAGMHLVFDGEMVMRRVRSFPAAWHELPDDELYALSLDIRR